jgi:predicted DCC family thiol-disulfide oxidoreductase YuxK
VLVKTRDVSPVGEIFYDGECPFCVSCVRRFERVLRRHRFSLLPLQSPGAASWLVVAPENLLDEMRLRLRDGQVLGGADALMEIARRIWWAWPLWAVSRLPGAMQLFRAAYRLFARNRACVGNACAIRRKASQL